MIQASKGQGARIEVRFTLECTYDATTAREHIRPHRRAQDDHHGLEVVLRGGRRGHRAGASGEDARERDVERNTIQLDSGRAAERRLGNPVACEGRICAHGRGAEPQGRVGGSGGAPDRMLERVIACSRALTTEAGRAMAARQEGSEVAGSHVDRAPKQPRRPPTRVTGRSWSARPGPTRTRANVP